VIILVVAPEIKIIRDVMSPLERLSLLGMLILCGSLVSILVLRSIFRLSIVKKNPTSYVLIRL
jgi:hypothetical protein